MGMTITVDERAPIPRRTALVLKCDNDHGLWPATPAHFDHGDYVENHRAAMRAGWKETYSCRGVRLWICPECSGKKAR